MNFAKLHSKKVYGKKISFLLTYLDTYLELLTQND